MSLRAENRRAPTAVACFLLPQKLKLALRVTSEQFVHQKQICCGSEGLCPAEGMVEVRAPFLPSEGGCVRSYMPLNPFIAPKVPPYSKFKCFFLQKGFPVVKALTAKN